MNINRQRAFGLLYGKFSHCGPKNGGRFSYWSNGRIQFGLNHRPMTKINRKAFLHMGKKGWRFA